MLSASQIARICEGSHLKYNCFMGFMKEGCTDVGTLDHESEREGSVVSALHRLERESFTVMITVHHRRGKVALTIGEREKVAMVSTKECSIVD